MSLVKGVEVVLNDIYAEADYFDQGLIVWDHYQTVDFLNYWHGNVPVWPKALQTVFNLVFQVSFANNTDKYPKIAYNCYNFETRSMRCEPGVDAWLQGVLPTFEFNSSMPERRRSDTSFNGTVSIL
jgi:hypothetical protein